MYWYLLYCCLRAIMRSNLLADEDVSGGAEMGWDVIQRRNGGE
jgi:hypothetical protein